MSLLSPELCTSMANPRTRPWPQPSSSATALGLRARIMPRWGELQLQAEDGDARLISVVAADPTGVDMDRVASAVRAIDDLARRSACAGRRDGGGRRDLASAAGGDMAVHARGGGRRCSASGYLRRPTSSRGATHIRERGGRRDAAPLLGPVQRKRLPAAILCCVARRRYRRAGGSVPVELITAPCRGLSMHGPCAGTACAQWRVGPHQGPHPPRRRPPDRMRGSSLWRSRPDCCLDWRFSASPCRSIKTAEPSLCGRM